MQVSINQRFYEGDSVEGFGNLLDEIDGLINAEVELGSLTGERILLLKSSRDGLLIYQSADDDDDGLHSVGDESRHGEMSLQLPYEDIPDTYPLAWCIDLEIAYNGLAYFFVNDGEKPPFISWRSD